MSDFRQLVVNWLFSKRTGLLILFALVSLTLLYSATRLRTDAGFLKLLPLQHEYMQTFLKYRNEFGGANRVLVALKVQQGDIFTPDFFDALKAVTDEVFFIPGVDRARVSSLFTPNTRFTEVVEDGISGGNVIPDDFKNTPEDLQRVRKNILQAGILGRLVANDFTAALVSFELQEIDPNTGLKIDMIAVADQLEHDIRSRYQTNAIHVHIIGFAKVIADIAAGAKRVALFFVIALLITAAVVYFYTQSFALSVAIITCAMTAVIWQLGLLPILGFGLDPMSILVPFLVFAIAVSHGIALVSAIGAAIYDGAEVEIAAQRSLRRLLMPGLIALASDTIGFITIMLIDIQIIQEMALTASIGVGVMVFTNFILLPLWISCLPLDVEYRARIHQRSQRLRQVWQRLSAVATPRIARHVLLIASVILLLGWWLSKAVKIGDLHAGVAELRADSVYNQDTQRITQDFSIGVDVLSVIAEAQAQACVDYDVMRRIDDFSWQMQNLPGVQSVIALPGVAKIIHAGWNEGHLPWRVLPRNQAVLAQSVGYVPTSSGLLNADCSAMPVYIFSRDHKAETIATIIDAVKSYQQRYQQDPVQFQLAANNLGVMAASNEAVAAAQMPILLYVFAAVVLFCLAMFKTWRGTLCVILPLGLVSILTYALMALLDIGLKVNTLPVVALGVGIGVDYGIYIFSCLQTELRHCSNLRKAYEVSLAKSGSGVVCTGMTLAISVATWIFSPLQFQADMGLLLAFMFVLNMLGAVLLLPALAVYLLPQSPIAEVTHAD